MLLSIESTLNGVSFFDLYSFIRPRFLNSVFSRLSKIWGSVYSGVCGEDSRARISSIGLNILLFFSDGMYFFCSLVTSYSSGMTLSSINQAWTTFVSGAWVFCGNVSYGYESSCSKIKISLFDGIYFFWSLVASYSSEMRLSSLNHAWTTFVSGAWVG